MPRPQRFVGLAAVRAEVRDSGHSPNGWVRRAFSIGAQEKPAEACLTCARTKSRTSDLVLIRDALLPTELCARNIVSRCSSLTCVTGQSRLGMSVSRTDARSDARQGVNGLSNLPFLWETTYDVRGQFYHMFLSCQAVPGLPALRSCLGKVGKEDSREDSILRTVA
jgi:hypothetical protein